MTWTRAENEPERSRHMAILQACPDYSAEATPTMLSNVIASGCELWTFTDSELSIAMAIRTTGRHKVVYGVPTEDADPEVVCRTLVQKIREVFDALGVTDFHAKFKRKYQSETMNEYLEYVDRVCHEVTPDVKDSDVRFRFHRPMNVRGKDNKFEGPAKDRPLPEKLRKRKERREQKRRQRRRRR